MCSAQVPAVILNVSRCGPGVGGIQPGQCDYYQATRGGGNGDYRIPVFAPDSIQAAIDIIYEATDLAQKYRNPVMILADGMMGQMMEPVLLPEPKYVPTLEELPKARPWAITGTAKGYRNVINSLFMKPEELEVNVEKIFTKYAEAEKELVRYETINLEDADVVFVAFGTLARITREAMEILETKGIKAGLIRPISLWPFPAEAFEQISSKTKVVISNELSMGQMIDDVERCVKGKHPVRLIHRAGGIVPTSLEIVDKAMKILGEY